MEYLVSSIKIVTIHSSEGTQNSLYSARRPACRQNNYDYNLA